MGLFALFALLAFFAHLGHGRDHFSGHVACLVSVREGEYNELATIGHGHEPCLTDEAVVMRLIERDRRDRQMAPADHNHPTQDVVHRHIVQHVGWPFSRLAALIAGVVTFVVTLVAINRFSSSEVTLSTGTSGVQHVMDIAFTRAFLLKALMVTIATSSMAVVWGNMIPSFRRGNRRDEIA